MSKAFSNEWNKALVANATDSSYASRINTITEPTGVGVFNASGENLQLLPFGTGADNSTFNMRVVGLKALRSGGSVLWLPEIICDLAVILSASVGVAGADIVAAERFADSIALTSGIAVLPLVPADTNARAILDISEYQKYEILFDLVTATAANCLVSRS